MPSTRRIRNPLALLLLGWILAGIGGAAGGESQLVVLEVSALPDPASTPYVDCLLGVRCRLASGDLAESNEVLILLFDGFRNRRLYPAADLKAGDEVTVEAVAFHDAGEDRRIMQANDFFAPTEPVFRVTRWEPQTRFLATPGGGDQGDDSPDDAPGPVTNTDLIRRTLMAHESEVTGGVSDDFYFWVHTPEILVPDFWKHPRPERKDAIGCREAILRFHRSLKARGIRLILAPVPRSTSIYPEKATNIPYDPAIDGSIDQPVRDLLADLEREGVECVDLPGHFLRQRYVTHEGESFPVCRRNDTHWSGAGVRLAAEAIAARIGSGTAPPGMEIVPDVIEQPYNMPVFSGKEARHRHPDRELIYRVNAPGSPALFDPAQPGAEIHLLGDSYVEYGDYGEGSHGLQAHLVALTGKPVNVFAANSGGPMVSRSQFAREADLASARVVVWVFAESFLMPDDIWFDVPLDDPSLTHLEFALDRAAPGDATFSPMEGLGSGIGLPGSGSVTWPAIEIGPGDSYPKFTVFAELLPAGEEADTPAEADFSVWFDGEKLGTKTLASGGGAVRTPHWNTGLKRLAGRTGRLELRAELRTETPGDWRLRWTLPQLRNAGFPGEFQAVAADTSSGGGAKPAPRPEPKEESRGALFAILLLAFLSGLAGIVLWTRRRTARSTGRSAPR